MASRPEAITRPSVIVGVDGSEDSRRALHWAAAHAGRRRLPLRVLHAVDFPHSQLMLDNSANQTDLVEARTLVESAVSDVERTWPGLAVTGDWLIGTPSEALARSANPTDLVVVGSRGLGQIGSLLIGSVSNELAQRATCPVVVVRWSRDVRNPETRRGVVVGVDGSKTSMAAVAFAFAAASERGLPLTVVHAVRDPYTQPTIASQLSRPAGVPTDDRERLDVAEATAGWKEQNPDVPVTVRYENGRAAQVLTDMSAGSDLLVVGSHGRGATAALVLGSTSRAVLERARCPVAVVRPSRSPAQRPTT
jgi:nucleotide-binding universal stress UspA family protein